MIEPLRIFDIVERNSIDDEVDKLLLMVGISPSEKIKISKPIKRWTKSADNHCSGDCYKTKAYRLR